jgi:hypothetical protein
MHRKDKKCVKSAARMAVLRHHNSIVVIEIEKTEEINQIVSSDIFLNSVL